MQKTSVIVAAASPPGGFPDLMAVGLAEEVRRRGDEMELVNNCVLEPKEVGPALAAMDPATPCALVLVGRFGSTDQAADHWLEKHPHLVVAKVPIADDVVLIHKRDPRLEQLVDAVQGLVHRAGRLPSERSLKLQLPSPANETEAGPAEPAATAGEEQVLELGPEQEIEGGEPPALPPPRPLLDAAIDWVHTVLKRAAGRLFRDGEETIEFTRVQIVDWLHERGARTPLIRGDREIAEVDAALVEALDEALAAPGGPGEPLAIAVAALELDALEFRLVLLALGPELDPRNQNWSSLLLDDPGRRVGTLGLYADLLGIPSEIIEAMHRSGRLARWRLFEETRGGVPAADAPLRLDPPVRAWLLGAADGLEQADPALRRILRGDPWPGASLIADEERARELVAGLGGESWLVLAGDGGPAAWRALVEAGAAVGCRSPLRAELSDAAAFDEVESSETGLRLARLALFTGRPLLIDAAGIEAGRAPNEAMGGFLGALDASGARGAIVTDDPARIARLLGDRCYRIEKEVPSATARLAALSRAAEGAGAHFTAEAAESLANLYPLQIDGLEQAMRLALARPAEAGPDALRARFITACKEVSAEGASGLAQRIEPIFALDDVVLPPDRKGQLDEIVDNVRFAPKVLEGWKFRDQLPYGLGVTALFHGPSGTGKTMASMAVAKSLGIQLLRLDLSRVVSKYIGDTEKNIDRVFLEAQLSGAGLLIDEADGLMSRRSEIKDAHDRYANLEVAYLLQRMEAFEGLCILTTNLRANVDSAFLRRLRFIIEFPRPDAAAREEIWRRCLPAESHALDDAAFRLLARRIELTGGSIRQITLRAAFLAAAAGTRIGPAQVAHAARAEFAKLSLPPVELDLVEKAAA